MLEAVIPAVWSAVHGWFTPTVLFVVLNIVIGTIAVTSKVAASSSSVGGGEGDGTGGGAWSGGGGGGEQRRLSRVPSMALDRLRSFNLSGRFAAAPSAPEAAVAGVLDLAARDKATVDAVGGEREREEEEEHVQAAHVERSRSEAAATAAADLPRLPARLRKSASDRSAFAHFEAEKKKAAEEEEREAVEARRPATTRDPPRVWLRVADDSEPEESDGEADEPEMDDDADAGAGEVDARADDFINNFRHQLKLQRIDSYLRHRDMLRRGHAAAAAAAVGSD
uniref:DUF4408 domain-containing protein n=1 Tax=Oryza punctata TaxID=4537 RepID=A0A0E0LCS6_ORYPU